MHDAEWLAFAQLFTLLSALLAFIQSRINAYNQGKNASRQDKANAETKDAIREIHVIINSGLTERLTAIKEQSDRLLEVSVKAAHARGMIEGESRELTATIEAVAPKGTP